MQRGEVAVATAAAVSIELTHEYTEDKKSIEMKFSVERAHQ